MAKPREWKVLANPETGVLDRDEVVQTLVDIEATGHLLGGMFKLAPVRQRAGDDYHTIGWIFQWHSTAPVVPGPQPAEPTEPDDDEADPGAV